MQLARQFFHRRLLATAVLRGPYSKTLCLSEGRFRGVLRGRSWFLFSQVTGVLMAVAPDRGSGAGVRPRDGRHAPAAVLSGAKSGTPCKMTCGYSSATVLKLSRTKQETTRTYLRSLDVYAPFTHPADLRSTMQRTRFICRS